MITCTGERMVPEMSDLQTYWEHVYRYRFAASYVVGKRVVDIACGEGYGSAALLRAGASSLVGVDISLEACGHARRKYGIDARVGDAHCIPLEDRSADVVVSFETIEHLKEPAGFLDECVRLLTPGGTLIISTPQREVYRQLSANNPYHCSELSLPEFADLLRGKFERISWFTQNPRSARWWDIRGFATDACRSGSWWWWDVRGFWRAKCFASRLLCRHLEADSIDEYRDKPVEAVLGRDGPLSSTTNPYVVRRMKRNGDNAIYLLAVATK